MKILRKISASRIILLFILCSTLVSLSEIRIVKASGTIYIRADGTVEGTDKIQRDGNFYTFTGDISDSIVVERDNIVIDGAGYTLQGTGSGKGISLTSKSNVTIKNTEINNFDIGVHLIGSSNNSIYENSIPNNWNGIRLSSSSNNNSITDNELANNEIGINTFMSHNNTFYNNLLLNNTKHVYDDIWHAPWYAFLLSDNIWDDGERGNYWDDYENRYPNATELDDSGVWDTPYYIDENNVDNYPLMDEGVNFEPYVSTFHLLFEDGSHNLLGNLTGELRITEPEKEIIHSICKLSLSSPRPDEYHKPYIDKVELFTAWTFIIHSWGPYPIPIPPPFPQKVTLHVDEDIILFEKSRNVSDFVEEPRLIFWFSSGAEISNHEWGTMILPTIRVYFSDGQKWEWEYEYDITPPFKLWSGMDVNLSELSGKIETETITFTTVEKGSPPIIDLLTYLYIILASTIIVAIAVAAAFVKYRKKKQT